MKTVLLVRMGEIFLKGDNRNFFIKALVRNLRKALEGTDCTLELTQGRIFLRDIRDMDEVIRRATRVFGVHSVSPVVECEKDMEVICARAIELMENCTGTVKLKLYKGNIINAGVWSEYSLYDPEIATFDEDEVYNQADSAGFINLFGLPIKVQAKMKAKLEAKNKD